MKNIFILVVTVLVLSISLNAVAAGTGTSKKGDVVPVAEKPKKIKYDGETINKFIKEFTEKVKDDIKGGKSITANEFLIYTGIVQSYYKYPDVELDTQIYRAWYKKLFDAVQGMGKVRQDTETAIFMNQKDKVDKYKEDYQKYFNDFKSLIINKKKFEIPDDKLRELQKKKDDAEREAKKKSRK